METGGIVEIAETILLEASYTKTYLDALIQLGPPVTHICSRAVMRKRSYMSSYGEQLVVRMLSMYRSRVTIPFEPTKLSNTGTKAGLDFLSSIPRFIESAFDDWFNSRHVIYVQELDRSFMSAHHHGRNPSVMIEIRARNNFVAKQRVRTRRRRGRIETEAQLQRPRR